MPRDVLAAFESLACEYGGLDAVAAAQYLREMELKGRYCVEVWV